MNYITVLKENLNSLPACSVKVQEKKEQFMDILKNNPIDVKALKKLRFTGIPDDYP